MIFVIINIIMIAFIVLSLITPVVISFVLVIGSGFLSLISLRKKISKIILGISMFLFMGILFSQLPLRSNFEDQYLSEKEYICILGVTRAASMPTFDMYDIMIDSGIRSSRLFPPIFKIKVNNLRSQDGMTYVNFTLYSFWKIPIGTREVSCDLI